MRKLPRGHFGSYAGFLQAVECARCVMSFPFKEVRISIDFWVEDRQAATRKYRRRQQVADKFLG